MIKGTIRTGNMYRITGTSSWGGTIPRVTIGKAYRCINALGLEGRVGSTCSPTNTITFVGDDGANCSLYLQDLADGWANRKEHAASVKDEIGELKKQIKQKEYEYERLSKFDSDEEEIASLLVTAVSDGGSEKERIENLAKLLKGRLRTDLL